MSLVLLAGGQVFFLWYLPFLPHFTIDLAQMSEIILTVSETQIKKKKKKSMKLSCFHEAGQFSFIF